MEADISTQAVGLASSTDFSLMNLFLRADIVVKSVIILLIACSVYSWAVIIEKFRLFKKINISTEEFETKFWKHARNLRTKIDPKFNELTQTLEPLPISVVKTFEQQGRLPEYGCWAPTSIKYWLEGMKK